MFDNPFDDSSTDDWSELQHDILDLWEDNPDMSPSQIADRLDCSASYARKTINEYRDRGGGGIW